MKKILTTTSTTHPLPKGVRLIEGAPKGAIEAVTRWFSHRGFSVKAAKAHNQARKEAGLPPFLEIRR